MSGNIVSASPSSSQLLSICIPRQTTQESKDLRRGESSKRRPRCAERRRKWKIGRSQTAGRHTSSAQSGERGDGVGRESSGWVEVERQGALGTSKNEQPVE